MPIESFSSSQPKEPCFALFSYQAYLLYTGNHMLKEKNNAMTLVIAWKGELDSQARAVVIGLGTTVMGFCTRGYWESGLRLWIQYGQVGIYSQGQWLENYWEETSGIRGDSCEPTRHHLGWWWQMTTLTRQEGGIRYGGWGLFLNRLIRILAEVGWCKGKKSLSCAGGSIAST